MKADDIRQRFLDFFRERGHEVRASSTLVPGDDPTLLFTNAGMVQFKKVFLGQEKAPFLRAATSQKCVRVGGKHNDLEEVGQTARHHTFFEMLGNFSFGDYFKRDAVRYAWDLLVGDFGMDPDRLFVTVHHSDDESAELWHDEVGVDERRIHRLGDKDNFWQMADTGPCGPCSEIFFDLRSEVEREGQLPTTEEFVVLSDLGKVVELWNLVFMQFDRDESGVLHPLPAPSIDTGAGLERVASVLQGVDSNFHIDLFDPLVERVAAEVGHRYDPKAPEGVSYRVLADHARSVAFLLADGVFPTNEGQGYVLRRILRRAVRHAWLLGRREPTLVHVVDAVVTCMGSTYPELHEGRDHLLRTTRSEEERFLATIEGGMALFDQIVSSDSQGTSTTISGDDAFRLYDTHGFPLDLTELMARERGYRVDVPGFERALDEQRARSRADQARTTRTVSEGVDLGQWTVLDAGTEQRFVGYESRVHETEVIAYSVDGERASVVVRENPFYLEGGGQISDSGALTGDGWSLLVEGVQRVNEWTAVSGPLTGVIPEAGGGHVPVRATLADVRHDTERNHTATHLLHAALRAVLGEHVVQRGSLVAPDRLRFDFAHDSPMTAAQREAVERQVNEDIWADHPVCIESVPYAEAVGRGAMALFGEKYGDVVRTVQVTGASLELCGGTHVRHTGEIGLFKILSETGIAAGVRRIEASTGRGTFRHFEAMGTHAADAASILRTSPEHLAQRVRQLVEECAELESLLGEVRKGGSAGEVPVHEVTVEASAGPFVYRAVRLRVRGADDARAWGDGFLGSGRSGVAVLAAESGDGTHSLFIFVTDDLIRRGVRADLLIREVAGQVGGKGGGRPHMAQAGVADPTALDEALVSGEAVVRRLADASAA
ncbi:MAG TPA: alanine--tRNA ligase [Gemmatimonadetes bacterium]|nr:alanine--tRNA ligase [Gemmatimonadota bacterium]|tara:strand:+ start:3639 stop:6302 length:2664 start_codon:yes stop_codon:yes gene_type:complete